MRVGKSVWHASRLNDFNAEIAEYGTPTEIVTAFNYLTIMPASSRGNLEVLKHGETLYDTWTGIANGMCFEGKFKEGDVMWVDGHTPIAELEEQYGNGATANAVIKSALETNFTINLILHRNQEQVKQ